MRRQGYAGGAYDHTPVWLVVVVPSNPQDRLKFRRGGPMFVRGRFVRSEERTSDSSKGAR
jgi:hypothetical protein